MIRQFEAEDESSTDRPTLRYVTVEALLSSSTDIKFEEGTISRVGVVVYRKNMCTEHTLPASDSDKVVDELTCALGRTRTLKSSCGTAGQTS